MYTTAIEFIAVHFVAFDKRVRIVICIDTVRQYIHICVGAVFDQRGGGEVIFGAIRPKIGPLQGILSMLAAYIFRESIPFRFFGLTDNKLIP